MPAMLAVTEQTDQMMVLLATLVALSLPATVGLAQDAENGKALYDMHCAVCHGEDADGGGPVAPALLLQPPSLHDLTSRHAASPVSRVVTRID